MLSCSINSCSFIDFLYAHMAVSVLGLYYNMLGGVPSVFEHA